jgi:hypothetical protein
MKLIKSLKAKHRSGECFEAALSFEVTPRFVLALRQTAVLLESRLSSSRLRRSMTSSNIGQICVVRHEDYDKMIFNFGVICENEFSSFKLQDERTYD